MAITLLAVTAQLQGLPGRRGSSGVWGVWILVQEVPYCCTQQYTTCTDGFCTEALSKCRTAWGEIESQSRNLGALNKHRVGPGLKIMWEIDSHGLPSKELLQRKAPASQNLSVRAVFGWETGTGSRGRWEVSILFLQGFLHFWIPFLICSF